MTEAWNSKTDVKEQQQLPPVNDGGGGGGAGGGNGIFKDLSSPHLLQKNTPKNKNTNEKLELFRNYFWVLHYCGFFPTMMLFRQLLFCSAQDSLSLFDCK